MASAGLLYGLQVILARLLSVGEFGEYSYIFALTTVMSFVVLWGGERLLIKDVSIKISSGDFRGAENYISQVNYVGVINLIPVFLISAVFISISIPDATLFGHYLPTFVLLLSIVFARISNSVARGAGYVIWPEFALNNLRALVALLLLAAWYYATNSVSVSLALYMVSGGFLVAYINTKYVTKKFGLGSGRNFNRAWSALAGRYGVMLPYFIMSIGTPLMSNLDIIGLGLIADGHDVGLYSASAKTVNVVIIALASANAMIIAKIAPLYKHGKISELRSYIKTNNVFVLTVSLFLFGVMAVYGDSVLAVYGEVYSSGSGILYVLLLGQVFNVLCGPVTIFGSLVGEQWLVSKLVLICCFAQFVAIVVAGPYVGVVGVAVITALVQSVYNLALAVILFKRTGVNVTCLSVVR